MDGKQAQNGAPSLLTMSARRGLNLAYSAAVEFMQKEEREEFESSLSMTLLEWELSAAAKKLREKEARQMMVRQYGEVDGDE